MEKDEGAVPSKEEPDVKSVEKKTDESSNKHKPCSLRGLLLRCCMAITRMCTKRTWRFIVRWYEVLVIFSLIIICMIGIEKMAFLGSGCCQSGLLCCEVEELLPINVSLPEGVQVQNWEMLCVDRPPTVKLDDCLTKSGSPTLESCLAASGHSEPEGFSPSKCLRDRTVFEGCMCVVGLIFASLLLFSECLLEIEPPTPAPDHAWEHKPSQRERQDEPASVKHTNPTGENDQPDDGDADVGAKSTTPAVERDLCSPCKWIAAHVLRLHRACVGSCSGRFFHLFGVFKYNVGRASIFAISGALLMLVAASHEAIETEDRTEDRSWFLVFLEGVFCLFVSVTLVLESCFFHFCIAPKHAIEAGIAKGKQRMHDRAAAKHAGKQQVEMTEAEALEEGQAAPSNAERRLSGDYKDEKANPMHGEASAPTADAAADAPVDATVDAPAGAKDDAAAALATTSSSAGMV
jgi:hypothetical protein